jgi:hypothetical protein
MFLPPASSASKKDKTFHRDCADRTVDGGGSHEELLAMLLILEGVTVAPRSVGNRFSLWGERYGPQTIRNPLRTLRDRGYERVHGGDKTTER